jgi:ankyrin repeat protein
MSALAWAVARDNKPAIDLLMSFGANPWATHKDELNGESYPAIFWAAALGRRTEFERFAKRPGRAFDEWPSHYLTAAMSGGDRQILEHLLAEPHQPVRFELLNSPLPDAAIFEPVLKLQPELAEPLMFSAIESFNDRPDLVRLALAHGANANAFRSYETALAKASGGIATHGIEIVDLLLKAGADPNLVSHRTRPIWQALQSMKLDESSIHWKPTGRARSKFNRLLASGADLNLPSWQGLPPIWFLLFPYSFDHTKLDASFVTPELLEMLASNGMDVNAEWNGKRVLGSVEARAGRDSELARTLRRLGAKP